MTDTQAQAIKDCKQRIRTMLLDDSADTSDSAIRFELRRQGWPEGCIEAAMKEMRSEGEG